MVCVELSSLFVLSHAGVKMLSGFLSSFDSSGVLISLVLVASVWLQIKATHVLPSALGLHFTKEAPRAFDSKVAVVGGKALAAAVLVTVATWLWRSHIDHAPSAFICGKE